MAHMPLIEDASGASVGGRLPLPRARQAITRLQSECLSRWQAASSSAFVSGIQDECIIWWQTTSSNSFLSHPISRRHLRKMLLPMTAVLIVCYDLNTPEVNQKLTPPTDILMGMLLCVASRMPTGSIGSDTLIAVGMFVYGAGFVVINPSCPNQTPFFVATNVFVGVHSFHNSVYLIATSAFFATVAPSNNTDILVSLVILAAGFVMECQCARILVELQHKEQAVDKLLDGGSDGFCTLCTVDGSITKASSRFENTFGGSNLAGVPFVDFVSDIDVQRIEQLCNKARAHATLSPLLVTCSTSYCKFDAKIIPFAGSADSLSVCVQVQGERRFDHPQGHRLPCPQSHRLDAPRAESISHPSAFQADTDITDASGVDVAIQTHAGGVDVALQTHEVPARRRPPALPVWMSGRPGGDLEYQAGSENSAGSRDRGPRARRRRGLIDFSQQPLLDEFRVTSSDYMQESVDWLLAHWNVPTARGTTFCCHFHAAAQILSTLSRRCMTRRPCVQDWQPFSAWQCPHCSLMNHQFALDCPMCWTEGPELEAELSSSREAREPRDAGM